MTYQESLELLQQVCNDLLRSQQHPSIAFAAKPKIEEALVAFSKCIEHQANLQTLLEKEQKECKTANDMADGYYDHIQNLQDTISNLREEIDELKSVHLAAEHGKAFEEAIPFKESTLSSASGSVSLEEALDFPEEWRALKVDEVSMGHEWRKNTGEQPVDDNTVVDIMLRDGTTGTDAAEVWDWGVDLEDFGRIEYWRPAQTEES